MHCFDKVFVKFIEVKLEVFPNLQIDNTCNLNHGKNEQTDF